MRVSKSMILPRVCASLTATITGLMKRSSIGIQYTMESAGLCSKVCPDGAKNFGVGCTRQTFSRCSKVGWREYPSALGTCYEDCNITAGIAEVKTVNGVEMVVKKPGFENDNWTMTTAGLCAKECPPGTTGEAAASCMRQSFSRGIGVPGWTVRLKDRKAPYGTKS